MMFFDARTGHEVSGEREGELIREIICVESVAIAVRDKRIISTVATRFDRPFLFWIRFCMLLFLCHLVLL